MSKRASIVEHDFPFSPKLIKFKKEVSFLKNSDIKKSF